MKGRTVSGSTLSGCPCGGRAPLRPLFRTATRRYVRCGACGLVFLYPRPPRETVEDYFRDSYDARYGAAEASDDRTPVFESVLAHLMDCRSAPGSILDIGCGDGDFLALCRGTGWTCAGIELSRGAAARAAKRGFTMLPPQALEEPDGAGSFDAVTLINVLETVADPLRMLEQAAQALSFGGVLLIRATNGSFHLPMRGPARWIGSQYDQAFHWFLYTAKALGTLIDAAGMTVISARNSKPSRGPVSVSHPWWSRAKWTMGRGLLWPAAQALYAATGGRVLCAPSFEIAARRRTAA